MTCGVLNRAGPSATQGLATNTMPQGRLLTLSHPIGAGNPRIVSLLEPETAVWRDLEMTPSQPFLAHARTGPSSTSPHCNGLSLDDPRPTPTPGGNPEPPPTKQSAFAFITHGDSSKFDELLWVCCRSERLAVWHPPAPPHRGPITTRTLTCSSASLLPSSGHLDCKDVARWN